MHSEIKGKIKLLILEVKNILNKYIEIEEYSPDKMNLTKPYE